MSVMSDVGLQLNRNRKISRIPAASPSSLFPVLSLRTQAEILTAGLVHFGEGEPPSQIFAWRAIPSTSWPFCWRD